MRVVLATYGSLGDVQPMLALALALKSSGHDVLLAAPPEKAEWVRQHGVPYHLLGDDVTRFIDGMKDAHSLISAFRFIGFLRKELTAQFEALPRIIAAADLVVGASLALALPTVAESLGITYRYVAFTPQLLPSDHHPFFAFKHHALPKWYNGITWRCARALDKVNLTRLINRGRRQLGLKPVKDAWVHILGRHVIVASDKAVAPVPRDVAIPFTQTGYLHLAQPAQAHPELDAFLGAGPPPVYAGFGSMPKEDQARNVPLIVRAARSAGQRAVISKFWDDPSDFSESDDVFFIKKYPHLRLFPRMAAVIHHGGAGTTAAAAASGVPQIIVPHILDQYYWGHQVFRSRLGTKPIWRSRLSSKKLAAAIRTCLSDRLIRQKAEDASYMINQQDSSKMAVREVMRPLQ